MQYYSAPYSIHYCNNIITKWCCILPAPGLPTSIMPPSTAKPTCYTIVIMYSVNSRLTLVMRLSWCLNSQTENCYTQWLSRFSSLLGFPAEASQAFFGFLGFLASQAFWPPRHYSLLGIPASQVSYFSRPSYFLGFLSSETCKAFKTLKLCCKFLYLIQQSSIMFLKVLVAHTFDRLEILSHQKNSMQNSDYSEMWNMKFNCKKCLLSSKFYFLFSQCHQI